MGSSFSTPPPPRSAPPPPRTSSLPARPSPPSSTNNYTKLRSGPGLQISNLQFALNGNHRSSQLQRSNTTRGTSSTFSTTQTQVRAALNLHNLTVHLPSYDNNFNNGTSRSSGRRVPTLSRRHSNDENSRDGKGTGRRHDEDVLRMLHTISGEPIETLRSVLHMTFFLPKHGLEFKMIQKYLSNSQEHGYGMEVVNVARFIRERDFEFHVHQPNALVKFESNATTVLPVDERYRMLLWHGTKKSALASIVKTGFILPQHGGMFGKGIYFADRASKSVNYCDSSRSPGSTGYLFLCDVMLGKVYKSMVAQMSLSQPPNGYESVKGCGKRRPEWKENEKLKGSVVPCGKTIDDPRSAGYSLQYNEYIVYDPSKVKIKYLVEIKHHSQPFTPPPPVNPVMRSQVFTSRGRRGSVSRPRLSRTKVTQPRDDDDYGYSYGYDD